MTMNPETLGTQDGGNLCHLLEFRSELLKKLSKLTGQGFWRSLNTHIITAMKHLVHRVAGIYVIYGNFG